MKSLVKIFISFSLILLVFSGLSLSTNLDIPHQTNSDIIVHNKADARGKIKHNRSMKNKSRQNPKWNQKSKHPHKIKHTPSKKHKGGKKTKGSNKKKR
ncbi:hypothetical protein ACOSZA_00050 [Mammaliicoccus sciuri]|uniref:hypothetical protein n=1 Tax=Mammaliicoccus sciuri TaxID=1296 RepID=UPI00195C136F